MSTTSPLVSVIIPCWNGGAYVGEAIESALAQTYPEVEVIVIDDGSTDGSLGVIRAFGDRIRWETGPNRGAPAARNRGLALARGAFIQFLDADDLLHADKLEKMVPFATEMSRTIVYSNRRTHSEDRPEETWTDSPSHNADAVVFALSKIVSVCAPLYRTESLQEVGGFQTCLACAQDYDLNIRLAITGWNYMHHPTTLVTVRRRAVSISHDSLKVLDQMLEIWRSTLSTLGERGQLCENRRLAIAGCVASAGRAYLKNGRPDKASACFAEALAIHPSAFDRAYNFPARTMRRLVGAEWTERAVAMKRKLCNRSYRPS